MKTPLELLHDKLTEIKHDYLYYHSRKLLTDIGEKNYKSEIELYKVAISKIDTKEDSQNTADATTNKQSDVIKLLREVYYYRLPHGVKVSDIIYEHNEGLSQLVYNTLNDTHL